MKRLLLATTMLASVAFAAHAQTADNAVKIGVLNDQSTSFSALGGAEVVEAVKLAIKDFGGQVLGKPITFVSADHQNKPDVGLSIARQWLERDNVDVIVDMANSAIALGVNTLIGSNKKIGLFVSPITDRPTEEDCNGYVVSWAYDAYSIARSSANAQITRGQNTWFVLSPDYEAGKALEATVVEAVNQSGGKVLGTVRAPLGTTDFSSYLLQAQASGAKMLMLTVNGPELVNSLKQVQEFGLIDQGMSVGVTVLHQSDARSIGAEALKGIQFASPWYWNADDASRQFAKKMRDITGKAPGWVAAGSYSATMNYLNAVKQAGTDNSDKVLETMRNTKINDFFARNATLWPNGRLIHDNYLLEVRAPGSVPDKEDVFKVISSVKAEDAFRPLNQTKCKLVAQKG
jgi:branched-chain amino acid transport system substrate-binding protein